ncbi:DUF2493 domain-containing protein [Crossiella sp. SN42]|uniref:DUF2493 domain-containing protein n=1 Tax=Crossiella sp. SN42 TaxID=2944808 RepID=UPI00207C65FA|nr:DUF2493 domain-containing protein [Crossiella sp. SN42]MCO1582035.1 DUF2493 domain-containing protein [Crossiella sp. SN42]
MTTPRILITGSRDWSDVRTIRLALTKARKQFPGAVLVHGACRGADLLAAHLWCTWGLATEAHPADWHGHGRAAGPIRNRHMVALGADLCLAFLLPTSCGSLGCAELAEAAGIRTIRIQPGDTR